MRRLWLHIGSHKTGTTTLQSALRRAGHKGKLGDWTYVHAEKSVNLNNAIAFKGEGAEMRWKTNTKSLVAHIPPTGNCIISGERFFWLDRKKEIAALHKVLQSSFDDIKVVTYLRRQDSLALSFRKTAISTVLGRRFFGGGLDALPDYDPHMDRYFDYAKKLSLWDDIFGAENIIVRRYGERDAVDDFSLVTGISLPQPPNKVNRSWSRTQLLAALWLQSKGYSYPEFAEAIDKMEGSGKLLPSKAQAATFLDRFTELNEILARKYDPEGEPSYFGKDLSMYPDISNNDLSDISPLLDQLEKGLRHDD